MIRFFQKKTSKQIFETYNLDTQIKSCKELWKAVAAPRQLSRLLQEPQLSPAPAPALYLSHREILLAAAATRDTQELHRSTSRTRRTRQIFLLRDRLRCEDKDHSGYRNTYGTSSYTIPFYHIFNHSHSYSYSTGSHAEMPRVAATKPPASAPAPSPAPAVSKKRKLENGETKYYAVRVGKVPGVYTAWDDCKNNTYGFKGASYKSFFTRKDAEDFVAGKNPAGVSDAKEPDRFYGVAVGTVPGVYTEWTDCQFQIAHVKGPKYKRFSTRAEAEEFVRVNRKEPAADECLPRKTKKEISGSSSSLMVEDGPSAKKVKIGGSSKSTSLSAAAAKRLTKCWTDGSSRGNGKVGASAGVGVFFGDRDSRNVSEPLQGSPQTNQRAELTAIARALQIAPKDGNLEIVTDSQYSINCVTVWYKNWMARQWLKSDGGEVVNKDLVAAIRTLIDARDARGVETKFTWIKGHADDPGNNAADRLAVAGAMMKRG